MLKAMSTYIYIYIYIPEKYLWLRIMLPTKEVNTHVIENKDMAAHDLN